MNYIYANIVADSIDCYGQRLTTIETNLPRIILAQLNKHRKFSMNTASSRAIPFFKMVQNIEKEIFIPFDVRKNEKGMQGNERLTDLEYQDFVTDYRTIWNWVKTSATELQTKFNLHKQTINRLIESYGYVRVLISSTEWLNFFRQRLEHDAQPEMQRLAQCIVEALEKSKPEFLHKGNFHLPYITSEEKKTYDLISLLKASTSRNARVSYLGLDGKQLNVNEDVKLFSKLTEGSILHGTPLEHVALCTELKAERFFSDDQKRLCKHDLREILSCDYDYIQQNCFANYEGWKSLRFMYEMEGLKL